MSVTCSSGHHVHLACASALGCGSRASVLPLFAVDVLACTLSGTCRHGAWGRPCSPLSADASLRARSVRLGWCEGGGRAVARFPVLAPPPPPPLAHPRQNPLGSTPSVARGGLGGFFLGTMARGSGSASGNGMQSSAAVKRILKEVAELAVEGNRPGALFTAAPLETDLFEMHFTVRGPPETAFEGGLYHGRILLPPEYPLKVWRWGVGVGRDGCHDACERHGPRRAAVCFFGGGGASWQPLVL